MRQHRLDKKSVAGLPLDSIAQRCGLFETAHVFLLDERAWVLVDHNHYNERRKRRVMLDQSKLVTWT